MSSSLKEEKDRRLFDRISKSYSYKDIYPVSRKARQFQIDSIMEYVKSNYSLGSGNNLLELGCGSGANSLYLESLYDKYMGIDYSEGLVDIAQQSYQKDNIRFEVANIKNLSNFGTYDIVFGLGILHHVDDLNQVLDELKKVGHNDTIYIFYEPQAGNPFLQFLRKLRMRIDSAFSDDQIFFKVKDLERNIENKKFTNVKSRYSGYFTPPFAQVILKPSFIFNPMVKWMIKMDTFLFRNINSRFSWNFIISFKKGELK